MPRVTLRVQLSVTAVSLAVGAAISGGDVAVAAQLPVPCGTGNCSPNSTAGFTSAPGGFVTYGSASAAQTGNTLTVSQSSSKAILNWASFNISADGKVVFQQPSASAVALNKIYQQSPSAIFGQLSANGQIYLINPNGFVFGQGATVNAAGLMASSLGLYNGDSEFTGSTLYSQSTQAPYNPALGTPDLIPGTIEVQPGASISVAGQGDILLAGQTVTNGGSLSAPDGQIVLAAGQTAYLTTSSNPLLRGLIVEVTGQGQVTNQAGGVLSAPRGNVSLIGLAVNQDGLISATTAVSANGSVILEAADGTANGSGGASCQTGETLCATQGGTLSIGPTSQISIQPDASQGTAVVAQAQNQSQIQLTGLQVDVDGGQISAPDGALNVTAAVDPDQATQSIDNAAAQIRVASGTSIDLGGSQADLPMSANLLSIQLLANELEDDPEQRNGALHGQTVIVDLRDGKPALISDSSWESALEGIEESIYQRTAAGGSANFLSQGDILFSSGAAVNVSGGAWNYAAGVTQTSELVAAGGQTYNISSANPALTYTKVVNPTYTETYSGYGIQVTQPIPGLGHYESAYSEGFSAGSVTFAAPTMALQGTLAGSAVDGLYQRNAATIPATSLAALVAYGNSHPDALSSADPFPSSGVWAIATGGTIQIGEPVASLTAAALPEFFAPAVTIVATPAPISAADGAALPPQPLQLPAAYLTSDGFATTDIFSDSTVTLPAGLPLNLGVGGSLQIVAPSAILDSSIQALGGSIGVYTAQTTEYQSSGQVRPGVDIGDGVTLNVSGQWTNDSMDAAASPFGPTYQDGGSIALSLTSSYDPLMSGGALDIGNGVSLLANGGAWVQYTNSVTGGTGGSITLDASPYQSAVQIGNEVAVQAFGVQGALGGAFTLNAPRIAVVEGNGSWATAQQVDDLNAPGGFFDVGAALFSQDGFSDINLSATAPVTPGAAATDVLAVTGGTTITAQAQSLQLKSGILTHPTGGTIQGLADAQLLPEAQQNPSIIRFNAAPVNTDPSTTVSGDLDIQSGSSLMASPGSTVTLEGQGSVLIDGVLRAPSGSITAQIDNPNAALLDPGYLPEQRLELGSEGVLDVSGITVPILNTLALPLGNVLAGGSVELQADRGDVITDPGSLIDIAGASAPLAVRPTQSSGYQLTTVGSAGGSLLVESSESVSLLGNLSAAAGASSSGALDAGSLQLYLSGTYKGPIPQGSNPFPTDPYTIDLVSSTAGMSSSSSDANLAVLGISQLEQSGIDELLLQADSTIELSSSTPLSMGPMGREISLDAPSIAVDPGVTATLEAPYVAFTDSQQLTNALPASAGNGTLTVSAGQIVLSSFTTLQGVQTANLNSTGDVEFEPLNLNYLTGGLTLAGDLNIDAARVYPATEASYAIDAMNGTVTIAPPGGAASNNATPSTPLSANGSLTIDANNIVSSGTLLAPFGQITLDATNSLSLLAGSITSVSADGAVIPYGQTVLGGEEWVYGQSSGQEVGVPGVPTRQLSLNGALISVAGGATLDLSGGGDLTAYEWVPGTGGSVDALSQASATAAGYYAVLPSLQGQYAAYDLQEFGGSSVSAGQNIYLSGSAGLPAGVYTLLPARYALLPGAFLIQAQSGYQSLRAGNLGTLPTGAPVVAGYFTFGNTGLHKTNGYTGFAIYPGGPDADTSYAQSLAQYTISNASSYFGASAVAAGYAVPLPADAGTLMVDIGSTLSLLGTVKASAAPGGTGATIDLYTAPGADLTVAASAQSSGGNGVTIAAPSIAAWNAGDLILGGVLSADGTFIDVTAGTVTIGSGAQVSADQVLAVADQGIDVQSGATVASTSGLSGTALKALPTTETLTLESGAVGSEQPDPNAALLAVSDLELPIAQRSGSASGGATITIESGATLATRGAVALDAPAGVDVNDNATVNAPGASWSLGSSGIAFVGSGGASADTLLIDPALLSQMQAAAAIRLASAGTIDLLTSVNLGTDSASSAPSLDSLTLSATTINNAGSNSSFGAQTVTLEGTGPGSGASGLPIPSSGSGSLTLTAGTLAIGGTGSLAINGDGQTTLQATNQVLGQGGTLAIGGDATIAAPELTAAGDTSTALTVQGLLQIQQSGTASADTALTGSLGGALALSASQIQDSGSIIVPGGSISLRATGDISGTGADIDAGGIDVSAVGSTYGVAGGIVDISAGGNLSLSNAALSVAGAGNSPAGFLTLSSGGTFSLSGGNLNGSAAPGATGGSFTLDAAQLSGGLASLPTDPSGAILAGFTNQIDVHVGSGDLDLFAGASLTANQINLTTDTGSIDVAGTVSAPSAALRGSIGLFAGNNVVLESSGQLLANGSATNANGGEIELSAGNPATGQGSITLNSGGGISAMAMGAGQDGTLWLRAPALISSAAIAINGNLATGVSSGDIDAGQIILEPVLAPIQSSADFTADFTPISSEVSSYLTQVQADGGLPASLQVPSGPSVVLQPGVVVQAAGDLTLGQPGQPFDLAQQGLGAPIDLTVQASGSIDVNGSISGFTLSDPNDAGAASSTLRFVAGANLASADPLATVAGNQGNLALGAGVIVQTGTGDLDLVASNDVTFATGASAYTTGGANSTSVPIRLGSAQVPVYFATGGGNLDVQAGSDIVGTPTQTSIASWQARTDCQIAINCASNIVSGEWGVNLAAFDVNPWSLATFGGGDLRITAGGDLQNVSAASADSNPTGTAQTFYASGGLTLNAAGNVTNGQYFVADSAGTLNIGRSLLTTTGTTASSTPAGSLFGLEDSSWSIWAQGDVTVDAIVNPTLLPQPQASGSLSSLAFYTYGPNSAFNAQSTSGGVSIANSTTNIQQLVGQSYSGKVVAFDNAYLQMPSTLQLVALSQDVQFQGGQLFLYPSSGGQLTVFAGQDIVDDSANSITMSDAPDAVLSTAGHVLPGNSGVTLLLGNGIGGISPYDFFGDIHATDPNPASIVAGRDIDDLTLSIPKQSDIEAGRNIVGLDYTGQNLNPADLTLIYAGGSVTDAPAFDPATGAITNNALTADVRVGGPGSVDVLASHDIDLGFSGGVTAVGNLDNGSLSAESANVTMAAGLGQSPAYAAFLQQVIEPSVTYQQQLVGYMESLTGQSGLSVSQADTEFAAFNSNQQNSFIDDVFFNELSLSGQEANSTPNLGYSRGYAAIADLFPGSPTGPNGNSSVASPYLGDLDLTYSDIESYQGGNISLLVPGGAINVGLAQPPGAALEGHNAKQPSQLGIIAQGGGSVDIYSEGSVNVNSSRIFAVAGGNVLIWSEEGNIDAGQGAKSSLSIPPPTIVVDPATGRETLDYSGAVAGSGIRTIQTDPSQPAGNVNLIAPVGSVNAGDAGIGAAGNINIAAAVVTGVANINFGGTATGVPALVSNVSASLSGAASSASAATTSATSSLEQSAAGNHTQQAPLAQAAISWLDVFVTGLGLQNCSPEDTQCLQQEQQQQSSH